MEERMKKSTRYNSKTIDNIKLVIMQHIRINIKDYLVLSIIFILGVMLGVIMVNNSNPQSKEEISGYINEFVQLINEGNYEIDKIKLLKSSIIENLKILFLIWFAGSTIIGIPLIYVIIGYKGFCIGYTISAIISSLGMMDGTIFSFSALFLQNIIVIPIILMLNVSALKLYRALIKNNKNINIKQEVLRHTLFCAILIVPLIIASYIETYISSAILC